MPNTPITKFKLDKDKLDAIRECTENYDVGQGNAEWPNNIISRQIVVYESGLIARKGEKVRHAVDPDELGICRRRAKEIAKLMKGVDVGMGSESGDPFREFYIAVNVDEPAAAKITEKLIRAKFAGTIFPPATITVEPMRERGVWWAEVRQDGSESARSYFDPWKKMIHWFQKCPDLVDSAFVRIGDYRALSNLDSDKYPKGTVNVGCVLPRLALGLTKQASLVGLFGYSVQT